MGHVTARKNVRLADLVTTMDFADALGVLGTTISAYRARRSFPEPVGFVNNVPVWTRKQLDEYLEKRPGRGARTDLAPVRYKK